MSSFNVWRIGYINKSKIQNPNEDSIRVYFVYRNIFVYICVACIECRYVHMKYCIVLHSKTKCVDSRLAHIGNSRCIEVGK